MSLIHHDLLTRLGAHFFPSLATIQVVTLTPDSFGEPLESWNPLAGHADIPCRIAPVNASERASPNMTVAETTHTAILAGHYPTLKPTHQAVIDLTPYDIVGVEHDSQGITTRLRLRIVSI